MQFTAKKQNEIKTIIATGRTSAIRRTSKHDTENQRTEDPPFGRCRAGRRSERPSGGHRRACTRDLGRESAAGGLELRFRAGRCADTAHRHSEALKNTDRPTVVLYEEFPYKRLLFFMGIRGELISLYPGPKPNSSRHDTPTPLHPLFHQQHVCRHDPRAESAAGDIPRSECPL